jgi:hypothetical protein
LIRYFCVFSIETVPFNMLNRYIVFFFLVAFVASCSNDFDLFTEKEDIPVVYGLLSKADETHYIRLERAFLDEDRSARVVAGEADSIFYSDATVEIIHLSTGDRFELDRINAAGIDLPRDEGDFPTDPNYLYVIENEMANLVGGDTYAIEVSREGQGVIAYSEAEVVENLRIISPVDPTIQSSLSYEGTSNNTVRWNEVADAEFYNLRLFFNYQERSPATGGLWEPRQVAWTISNRIRAASTTFRGDDFLQFLGNVIPEDPTADRRLSSLDLRLDGVGRELARYIEVGQANLGITASNEIPLYTNIDGGLGVFSSTNYTVKGGYILAPTARDSLIDGRFTGHLNFIP